MAKINIVKPTGSDTLSLLSAFRTENMTYVILDGEKVGSMGLPIIYISKLTEKLEKITDDNEWQSVKNSLKGIINGTNFEYVKINDTLNADEVYFTPLTLPQSSFDLIKTRYVVNDDSTSGETRVLEQPVEVDSMPTNTVMENAINQTPDVQMPVASEINNQVSTPITNENANPVPEVPTVAPVMPTVNAESNASYVATPNVMPDAVSAPTPEVVAPVPVENVQPVVEQNQKVEEVKDETPIVKFDSSIFMQDKETFLKACENMFDALVSKYQKQIEDLERREQVLKDREQEVVTKLNDANEHLANAAAREQVANIAHDNAQKIMDINNLMPSNPIAN